VSNSSDSLGPLRASIDAALSSDAEAFPMLTEVVQLPRYQSEELPGSLSDVDWTALALRVRENVMERLLRRSDLMLDAQLNSTLRSVLERATEALSVELHDALSRMIRELVSRAVSDELTRLHTEMARRTSDSANPPATTPQ
jgi:hypothetical protein